MPPFKIVTTSHGAKSIGNTRVDEIMHNPLGPLKEIQELYLNPSQWTSRCQNLASGGELVLYDIGLGAGFNGMSALMAAQRHFRGEPGANRIRIISFEKDLDLARFALRHRHDFSEYKDTWRALEILLNQGQWQHPLLSLEWKLLYEDCTQSFKKDLPAPDLIFYDPYSPKKNPEMWTREIFSLLFSRCHRDGKRGSLLLTYSRATSIRAAMLLAGFFVGYGDPLGQKEETTCAATLERLIEHPLDHRWLKRWHRSHQALPTDLSSLPPPTLNQWRQRLEAHPQFH